MKEKTKEYGRRIAAIRAYIGMTRSQLAAELGITERTLYNYESGRTIPPVDIWDRLNAMATGLFKP